MDVSITIRTTVEPDVVGWVVFATLDSFCPHFTRHHFAVRTNSRQEALGVAGDLIALSARLSKAVHSPLKPIPLASSGNDCGATVCRSGFVQPCSIDATEKSR
jgi:hypothetical protein